jgi:hypothetical protein
MMMVSMLVLGIVTQVWRSSFIINDPCPEIHHTVAHSNQTITHEIVFNNPNTPSKDVFLRELSHNKNLLHTDSRRDYDELLIMKRQVRTGDAPYNLSSTQAIVPVSVSPQPANASNGTQPVSDTDISRAAIWVTFFSLMTFVAGYALGFGPGNKE